MTHHDFILKRYFSRLKEDCVYKYFLTWTLKRCEIFWCIGIWVPKSRAKGKECLILNFYLFIFLSSQTMSMF